MPYFTFDKRSAERAMKWMLEHDGSTAGDDIDVANDIRDFMELLGYDRCIGLPGPTTDEK